MPSNRVKYRHAFNSLDELIEIGRAKEVGGVYHCPHCGAKMIRRCGDNNAWHFAHLRQENCDYSHYLHTIAELQIQQWINTSIEVNLCVFPREYCNMRGQCNFYSDNACIRTVESPKKYNLKTYYGECEREKRIIVGEHSFVADLLWHHKKDPKLDILIEVHVTNPCSELKINSGARIIEFNVQSEDDLESIINKPIIGQLDDIYFEYTKLYNFILKI